MDLGKIERNKRMMVVSGKEKMVVKREEDEDEGSELEDKRKKGLLGLSVGSGKKGSTGAGMRCCQAEKCSADLSDAKQYHRRHKVCEIHAKAQVVLVSGIRQRFCQQCSRFGISHYFLLSCFPLLFSAQFFLELFLNWMACLVSYAFAIPLTLFYLLHNFQRLLLVWG